MIPCGPAHVEELARTAHTRVYEQKGVVRTCYRGRSSSFKLGTKVVRVILEGRSAAVIRRTRTGQSLRVYNLRTSRPQGTKERARRFTVVRLSPGGTAAFIAPDGARYVARDTSEGVHGAGSLDPSFLEFRGRVVATRRGHTFSLSGLSVEGHPAADGRLITQGTIAIDVRLRDVLVAQRGAEEPVRLGDAVDGCESPSACSGISSLQIAADRYLAAPYNDQARYGGSQLTVHDLVTRTHRRVCDNAYFYVLGDSGRMACSDRTPLGGRIRVEGVVLDEGAKVVPDSLERRGDQIVWRSAGVERTAPLP